MAIEAQRGCGFRKVGGLYLVCDGPALLCGRLPFPLHVCPTCSGGIKQTRGWTWIKPGPFLNEAPACAHANDSPVPCPFCPLSSPEMLGERAGLLWIGEQYYPTPAAFLEEARRQGISRRISAVPRDFKLGEHWVLFGHPKAATVTNDDGLEVEAPGVFGIFKPTRLEKIVRESEAADADAMEALRKRGITPVAVPDGDPDHDPRGTADTNLSLL